MKEKEQAIVLGQKEIGPGIHDMVLHCPKAAEAARPGQFVLVYCEDGRRLLPRPLSLCETDKKEGTLRLVYRTAGGGTAQFAQKTAGDTLEVLGPLGNGFTLKKERAILVGGGIGIPPLLELAKQLDGEKTVVLGYKDALFLTKDFKETAKVVTATEDGSAGVRGTVLDAIEQERVTGDVIYACGPMPMLQALARYAAGQGLEAQISLEERMACGIGACLGCVCDISHRDLHTNVCKKRICKDGPVFDAKEVVFP